MASNSCFKCCTSNGQPREQRRGCSFLAPRSRLLYVAFPTCKILPWTLPPCFVVGRAGQGCNGQAAVICNMTYMQIYGTWEPKASFFMAKWAPWHVPTCLTSCYESHWTTLVKAKSPVTPSSSVTLLNISQDKFTSHAIFIHHAAKP